MRRIRRNRRKERKRRRRTRKRAGEGKRSKVVLYHNGMSVQPIYTLL